MFLASSKPPSDPLRMRTTRSRRLKAVFFLGVGVAASGLALLLYGFDFLKDFERQTVDTRFSLRGTRTPSDVVIVGIDDPSFPFRRRIYAPLLDNLRRDGV